MIEYGEKNLLYTNAEAVKNFCLMIEMICSCYRNEIKAKTILSVVDTSVLCDLETGASLLSGWTREIINERKGVKNE